MTRVSFDVPMTIDSVVEQDEDFTLTIDSSSLPDGFIRGNPGSAKVNISETTG